MNSYPLPSPPSTPTPTRIVISAALALSLLLSLSCRRQAVSDVVTMVIEKKINHLDPRMSTDSADERIRQLLFTSLTRKNEQFDAVPDLAASMDAAPDYKTFTFKMRDGIKFHDGRPLTSADVKYTFDTLLKLAGSQKRVELQANLDFVEAPDPQTVLFRCKNPMPGFANIIVPIGIIPSGSEETIAKNPIGTGPYKFVSFTQDQEIVLAANENYSGGKPAVNTLRIRISPDNSTRESELRAASADLAINADFDPVTVEGLQKAQGVRVRLSDGANIAHLGLNLNDPILKDQRIRQALAYGINREAIIRDLLRNQARLAHNVLPPAQWAFEPAVTQYNHDPEKAKQLLDAAGKKMAGDKRFDLTLKVSPLSISRKVAEMMQEQLRAIGVNLKIEALEFQKMNQDITDGNFQLYYRIALGANQSTDIFKFMYSSKSIPPNGQNRMRYNNPKVDKLLDESLLAPRDRQKQIFSETQKILADELPQMYLWYPSSIIVQNNRIADFTIDPSGDWVALRNLKLNQQ